MELSPKLAVETPSRYGLRQLSGLVLGPLALLVTLLLPAPERLSPEGWRTAGVGMLLGLFWISEAIPIPATALLPVVLFPALGVLKVPETTANYGHPLIFLFLGGFLLSLAMMRSGLHRRIALNLAGLLGTSETRTVAGFMLATGSLSLWVGNAATTLLLLPVAVSLLVIGEEDGQPGTHGFAPALLLGIAYSSSIGGLGTLIGTPPNALMAAYLSKTHGFEIGFGQWMLFGVPLVYGTLPLAWLILIRLAFKLNPAPRPAFAQVLAEQRRSLGPMSRAEWSVTTVLVLTALGWISREGWKGAVPWLDDTWIAMVGGCSLFLVPEKFREGRFLITWKEAEKLPWDTLILYGGGLSLALAVQKTGLAEWLAGMFSNLQGMPPLVLIAAVSLMVLFLTEFTSNTATTSAFLPVVGAAAVGMGVHPAYLVIPATVAASCAFMLPVGTPPNAIVFGTGRIALPEMVRAGVWLNLLYGLVVPVACYFAIPLVFGL